MAYMVQSVCFKCGKSYSEAVGSDMIPRNMCHDCMAKQEDEARKKHFDELDKLTMDERVRKIEELIYEKPWKHTHSQFVRY